jgi:LTXXQ motif family protein
MRKALIPMLASLALCGAAATALIASNARAQANPRKPAMVALVSPDKLAQNMPQGRRAMRMPSATDMTQRMKQMCEDGYAREVGRMAYLETRLNLTQPQQPLFARWKEAKLGIAKRRSADCSQMAASPPQTMPSPVDRLSREEDRLKKRIADIDAERPALTALYNALTPEQRQDLSSGRRGMMRGGMTGGGMMRRGMMGQGMGQGPMNMGGPPPAPPPPQ